MSAPLRDVRFLLHDVLDYAAHYRSLGLNEAGERSFIDAILDEGHRFTTQELEPLNASGDVEGCQLEDGVVTTPSGFKQAYAKYVEAGWAGLVGAAEYGGQDLPHSFGFLLEELMSTANMAWAMYPGLSRGCVAAITEHGSNEQKAAFLPKLLTGEWTGTMCLTEPHAGSDVGLARTKAQPSADGTYQVSGTKIFISAGEHDMADNIVHLVLARLPDAPSGTKGISMFVVPKFLADGERNGVRCGNIEEKMGIHGNATCELLFSNATGYLVGEPNQGMKYMFTMMNAARLAVGLQGVAIAQSAFYKASAYAAERVQMRSLSGPKAPDLPADPILVHPDVRRLLLTQRTIIEGGRCLVYFAAQLVDQLQYGDADAQAEADVLLDFLTPIVKAALTELGFESVNHAVQVFGGHGFIRETGVEQFVRDARITMIYEGTTGIQALDLLGRKVIMTQGAGLQRLSQQIDETLEACDGELAPLAEQLAALNKRWLELSLSVGAKALENPDEVGAASVDYLFFSGYVVLGYMWLRMAMTGLQTGDDYGRSKVDLARFYFAKILPRTAMHEQAMLAGGDSVMQVNDSAFDCEKF